MMCPASGGDCVKDGCMAWRDIPGVLNKPTCTYVAAMVSLVGISETVIERGFL